MPNLSITHVIYLVKVVSCTFLANAALAFKDYTAYGYEMWIQFVPVVFSLLVSHLTTLQWRSLHCSADFAMWSWSAERQRDTMQNPSRWQPSC